MGQKNNMNYYYYYYYLPRVSLKLYGPNTTEKIVAKCILMSSKTKGKKYSTFSGTNRRESYLQQKLPGTDLRLLWLLSVR
jgi:hypothetical protein